MYHDFVCLACIHVSSTFNRNWVKNSSLDFYHIKWLCPHWQVDYASFSPADMRLNNSVFQWHFRMPEVFEEHKKIINANRVQYENSLKVRQSASKDKIVTRRVRGCLIAWPLFYSSDAAWEVCRGIGKLLKTAWRVPDIWWHARNSALSQKSTGSQSETRVSCWKGRSFYFYDLSKKFFYPCSTRIKH